MQVGTVQLGELPHLGQTIAGPHPTMEEELDVPKPDRLRQRAQGKKPGLMLKEKRQACYC